jgi:hypothetical protein
VVVDAVEQSRLRAGQIGAMKRLSRKQGITAEAGSYQSRQALHEPAHP